jgi:DHA3 family macrolide efflux protein-like MFS transporter
MISDVKKRLHNARLFIISESLILFFCMTVSFAISWYVTLDFDSPVMLAVITTLSLAPTFLLAPIAGVWADRHNRKRLIIRAYSIIGGLTFVLAVIYTGGYYHVWMLLLTVVAMGIGQAILFPTVGSVLPDIVTIAEIDKLNGFRSTAESAALFAAPAAGGFMLVHFTFEKVLYLGVAIGAAGLIILAKAVKIPEAPVNTNANRKDNTFIGAIKSAASYILHNKMLKSLFLYLCFFELTVAPIALLNQIYVIRQFGAEYWRLTVNETAYFVGMIIGGIVMSFWGGFREKTHTLALAALGYGICAACLGFAGNFWSYIFFTFMSGVFMPLYDAPAQSLIETKVPPAYMGRIFAVATMIMTIGMPIGSIVIAPLEEHNVFPLKPLFVLPGVIIALSSLYYMLNPHLRSRNYGEKNEE